MSSFMLRRSLCFGSPNELANPQAVQKDVNDACKQLGVKEPTMSMGENPKRIEFRFDSAKNQDKVTALLEEKYGQVE